MAAYVPPLRDMLFCLEGPLAGVAALPDFAEASAELVDSVLTEAASIAEEVLSPLNTVGDRQGARLDGTTVRTPEGWHAAWRTLVDGGWNGLPFSAEAGGMGLPNVVNVAVQEMWHSANMAFALCPMLTQGAVNAIAAYGSDAQKELYLPKLVSGEWTGTMNLTEPQAGSDLAAIRSKAVPDGDGYRVSGQKIFITYGDHDLTDNIVHLVLARLPDAPPGVKGISLFLVPKVLADGGRNDVHCVSLEHKLGIHGSPTAVLSFGDHGGAWGELIGEANRGLEYMFAMMNHARQSVGLQGLAIAERAYQQALGYARDRVQGLPAGWTAGGKPPIAHHPDVRRMLMLMKSQIEAMRGLVYTAAAAIDVAHGHPDSEERARAHRLVELLTPIVKGWCTETGCEIASLGVQIHGGMGYIEETGAAQHFRDARITTIYEGTTGIQANDLVFRKVLRDRGEAIGGYLGEVLRLAEDLGTGDAAPLAAALTEAVTAASRAVEWLLLNAKTPELPAAAAANFLKLMGIVAGGFELAKMARVAAGRLAEDADGFHRAKLTTANFYARHVLPQAAMLAGVVTAGSEAVLALEDDHL